MTSTLGILAALALSLQATSYDTVILSNGGVLRGTVVEDVPGADLVLLMPDGTSRKIPRAEIVRVDWVAPPPAPPPPPPAYPPPAYPEPPPPTPSVAPKVPADRGPLSLGLWMAGAVPSGTLDGSGLSLSSAFRPQLVLGLDASWRVADPLELGVYLRLGGGASRGAVDAACLATGGRCDAFGLGVGLFPRWSFAPRAAVNPWVQVGGGLEYLTASNDSAGIDYDGWEMGAWVGVDFRAGPVGALGLFAGARWGEFTSGAAYGGFPMPWGGTAAHGWIDVGVRWAWWP